MRRLQLVVLLVALALIGVGETGANRRAEIAKPDQAGACAEMVTSGAPNERLAQQDCCKAQKGVCGCRAGKIVCCDKSFSDTCTCNRDDEPGSAN